MFFTPLDIQNAEFKKSMYGYSDEEVDSFLDKVMNDYQEMRKEIDDLQGKISILNDGMKQYKNMESSLKETLILAQHTAEEVREEAVKKANNIIKEAELKADEIVQGARYKLFELNQTLKEMKLHALAFKTEYVSKLQSELSVMDSFVVEDDFNLEVKLEKPDVVSAQVKSEEIVADDDKNDDFAREIKETLDAVFEEDTLQDTSVGLVNVKLTDIVPENDEDVATEAREDTVDSDVDEQLYDLFDDDTDEPEEDSDMSKFDELFSKDLEENNQEAEEKSIENFKNRFFRRNLSNENNAIARDASVNKEYKSRFIADLDSDEDYSDTSLDQGNNKENEIKKWFLDD